MTTEELKAKLASIKLKEQELSLKEQAIAEFKPLFDGLKSNVQQATATNNILVLKEIFSNTTLEMNSASILEAIESQSELINNELLVSELKKMVQGIAELEKKNYFDPEEFKNTFINGLSKVINIVVESNKIPNSTEYSRDAENKIKTVTERYDTYILESTWAYNSKGYLVNVRTVKNATK